MISIVSEPERIILGETLKVKLNIEGKVNDDTYKNKYFNLTIKKNGGTHGTITLYPLKYIGCPLEWEVNPYSYAESYGTFNVICTLQNSTIPICNTTFVVEPDSAVAKTSSVSNITGLLQNINIRKGIARKQEEKPEYFKSYQVQKPEQIANSYEINFKEKEIEKKNQMENETNKTNLLNTVKVQRAFRNC